MELPDNIGSNEYSIELVESNKLSYGPIYNLTLMELEISKTFIKTHLKPGFVKTLKSLIGAPILF